MRRLLICFSVLFLSANTDILQISLEKPIELEEAAAWKNRVVKVRGFLYQLPSGEFILDSQTNLKSCCIGSQARVKQQIQIRGDIQSTPQVVTLQGIFQIVPKHNEKGEIVRFYFLENAQMVESNHSWLLWPLAGIFLMYVARTLVCAFKKWG